MPYHSSYTLPSGTLDTTDSKVAVETEEKNNIKVDVDPINIHRYQIVVTLLLFYTWVILVRKC